MLKKLIVLGLLLGLPLMANAAELKNHNKTVGTIITVLNGNPDAVPILGPNSDNDFGPITLMNLGRKAGCYSLTDACPAEIYVNSIDPDHRIAHGALRVIAGDSNTAPNFHFDLDPNNQTGYTISFAQNQGVYSCSGTCDAYITKKAVK